MGFGLRASFGHGRLRRALGCGFVRFRVEGSRVLPMNVKPKSPKHKAIERNHATSLRAMHPSEACNQSLHP